MKSAYELALERLERDGIERPREEALSPEVREQIAEVRRQAEARWAEIEILYQYRLKSLADPAARHEAEEHYLVDRRRVEADRDSRLARLRGEAATS